MGEVFLRLVIRLGVWIALLAAIIPVSFCIGEAMSPWTTLEGYTFTTRKGSWCCASTTSSTASGRCFTT